MEGKEVCYPYVTMPDEQKAMVAEQIKHGKKLGDNVTASHQWFTKYRKDGGQALPRVKDAGTKQFRDAIVERLDWGKDFEVNPQNVRHGSRQPISGRPNGNAQERHQRQQAGAGIQHGTTEQERFTGKVVSYNSEKLSGYIQADTDGSKLFFRATTFHGNEALLHEPGLAVSFAKQESTNHPGKFIAVNIKCV